MILIAEDINCKITHQQLHFAPYSQGTAHCCFNQLQKFPETPTKKRLFLLQISVSYRSVW